MKSIITLTTDFGLTDSYTGAMKGAMLSVNPETLPVDITHGIPPGDVTAGAMVLREAAQCYPPGTVHVGVVDPGVGGSRRPVLVETERYFFVGPDNGLFSLATEADPVKRVVELTKECFFRGAVSSTFHGRDIFAPVAAHLTLGMDPALFGRPVKGLVALKAPAPVKRGGCIYGRVVSIDAFGNVITNIKKGHLPGDADAVEATVAGVVLKGLRKTYASADPGELLLLINSSGHLEVASNGGSASKALGVEKGDKVTVRTR